MSLHSFSCWLWSCETSLNTYLVDAAASGTKGALGRRSTFFWKCGRHRYEETRSSNYEVSPAQFGCMWQWNMQSCWTGWVWNESIQTEFEVDRNHNIFKLQSLCKLGQIDCCKFPCICGRLELWHGTFCHGYGVDWLVHDGWRDCELVRVPLHAVVLSHPVALYAVVPHHWVCVSVLPWIGGGDSIFHRCSFYLDWSSLHCGADGIHHLHIDLWKGCYRHQGRPTVCPWSWMGTMPLFSCVGMVWKKDDQTSSWDRRHSIKCPRSEMAFSERKTGSLNGHLLWGSGNDWFTISSTMMDQKKVLQRSCSATKTASWVNAATRNFGKKFTMFMIVMKIAKMTVLQMRIGLQTMSVPETLHCAELDVDFSKQKSAVITRWCATVETSSTLFRHCEMVWCYTAINGLRSLGGYDISTGFMIFCMNDAWLASYVFTLRFCNCEVLVGTMCGEFHASWWMTWDISIAVAWFEFTYSGFAITVLTVSAVRETGYLHFWADSWKAKPGELFIPFAWCAEFPLAST